jgi:hypothetical protein
VVRIISAMLVILDQPKVKANLGPGYVLPSAEADIPKLWAWERQQLVLDRTHPLCIPIRMSTEIKKGTEDTTPEGKVRMKGAKGLMEGITHQETISSSQAVSFLRKWVLAVLNANNVNVRMKDLGYEK